MEIAKAFGERVVGWTWGKGLRGIVFKCLGSFNSNTQTPTPAQRLTAGKHANTHRCIVVLLWLLLALVVTGTAAAATVEGRVVDENDQPLAGANVQLFDERSGAQRYGTARAPTARSGWRTCDPGAIRSSSPTSALPPSSSVSWCGPGRRSRCGHRCRGGRCSSKRSSSRPIGRASSSRPSPSAT